MNLQIIRKRMTQPKKSSRSKKAPAKVRVERTVGVVLVVLMGAAAMMLAARRPTEAVDAPVVTSKVVAPAASASARKAPLAAHIDRTATAPKNASASAAASPAVAVVEPVTITGCLELDHDAFKLKDTEGADAPTSRSWKSGFLRKRTATVTVVDASNRWKLAKHVGERVSVTGPIADRELDLRSLSRVSAGCE